MGAAIRLLDAVKDKLNEETFGSITFVRRLLPEVRKEDLGPTCIVALQSKESFEQDRSSEFVQYTVVVGLHHPFASEAELDNALDLMEDINDHLAHRDNKTLVSDPDTFKLLHPVLLETPFDAVQAREAATFFSVLTLKYLHYKNRS